VSSPPVFHANEGQPGSDLWRQLGRRRPLLCAKSLRKLKGISLKSAKEIRSPLPFAANRTAPSPQWVPTWKLADDAHFTLASSGCLEQHRHPLFFLRRRRLRLSMAPAPKRPRRLSSKIAAFAGAQAAGGPPLRADANKGRARIEDVLENRRLDVDILPSVRRCHSAERDGISLFRTNAEPTEGEPSATP